jgi:transposase
VGIVNVLKMDKQQQIQSLIGLGWTDRRIHRETGINRITIARYRKTLQSMPQVPTDVVPCQPESVPHVPTDSGPVYPATKSLFIEPYREVIWRKHTSGLTAQRIYQDMVEAVGYAGGYDSIKRYVRKMRGNATQRLFAHLPVVPGYEAQVDFGQGALVWKDGRYRWAWLFKMTLSFSGHAYEELVYRQDVETFLLCHEHAFAAFGGVPATVKLDNLKSGVLKASLYEPELNPLYQSFSEHWGFVPNPCPPAKPEHKGRVEKDVCYTKSNALRNRKFASLEEGNLFLKYWNKRWAQTRIHGSKKCQVLKLFTEFEQAALKPLAEKPFAFFKIGSRKVDPYGCIEVSGNFYPMPAAYLSQRVQVHFNSQDIKVYDNQFFITSFKTQSGKGHVASNPNYPAPGKSQFLEEMEGRACRHAKEIGPSCHALVHHILSVPNDPMALRRCLGINSLAKKHPAPVVEHACKLALERRRYSFGCVRDICEAGKVMSVAEPELPLIQEHELIRNLHEYQTLLEERTV